MSRDEPSASRPTASARSRCRPTAIGARRPSARCRISRSAASACRRDRPRARHRQAGGGAGEPRARRARAASSPRPIEHAAAGGDRRQARRPVPAGHLADRLRHPDQHERQRGDRRTAPTRCSAAPRGGKAPVHPNDHVNNGQSSNDSFPTAMHIAAAEQVHARAAAGARAPARGARRPRPRRSNDIVKIGRTHLQDATPLTLGQEFSGYAAQIALRHRAGQGRPCRGSTSSRRAAPRSAPASTRRRASPSAFAEEVAAITGLPFVTAPNKFAALAAHDALVELSRRAQHARGQPDQDRQRHPAARLGPALRPRRAEAARERARQLDHAGQGQPDPVPRR